VAGRDLHHILWRLHPEVGSLRKKNPAKAELPVEQIVTFRMELIICRAAIFANQVRSESLD
jgi:hypothetical protein